MIDLDEIKKLAKSATPGPWSLDTERSGEWWIGSTLLGAPQERGGGMYITRKHLGCIDDNEADAEFIAAANPQAVLELIERVRQAEARIAEAAKLHRPVDGIHGRLVCSHRHCVDDSQDQCAWPCETAIALGLNEGDER